MDGYFTGVKSLAATSLQRFRSFATKFLAPNFFTYMKTPLVIVSALALTAYSQAGTTDTIVHLQLLAISTAAAPDALSFADYRVVFGIPA